MVISYTPEKLTHIKKVSKVLWQAFFVYLYILLNTKVHQVENILVIDFSASFININDLLNIFDIIVRKSVNS